MSQPAYLFLCQGPSCSERGGAELLVAVKARLARDPSLRHLAAAGCTCLGSCATGPNGVAVDAEGVATGLTSVEAALDAAGRESGSSAASGTRSSAG